MAIGLGAVAVAKEDPEASVATPALNRIERKVNRLTLATSGIKRDISAIKYRVEKMDPLVTTTSRLVADINRDSGSTGQLVRQIKSRIDSLGPLGSISPPPSDGSD